MKQVKARLIERRVPVYMVDAGLGDHFSTMTVEGLFRAKAKGCLFACLLG